MEKIEFTASLPPIQSAINLDGQGDGARIKLDIPRSYVGEVLKLQALSGKSFKVTITIIDDLLDI
ncbi:MAG: hypothetical protein WDA59_09315 [Methanofastidiosum sp.]|jgi:hypothetical protein